MTTVPYPPKPPWKPFNQGENHVHSTIAIYLLIHIIPNSLTLFKYTRAHPYRSDVIATRTHTRPNLLAMMLFPVPEKIIIIIDLSE